ncbi:uncharacterized protein LOC111017562 [Momordica charantia]|uniref:Uncharacterized protein LOC111017562 n=1 Tax=Momordica charantia TaxID=3673 RepID=A0A6J1D5R7_MOMCH|nr:uncharacterized protein LOC111017562 [Momordica charantia]
MSRTCTDGEQFARVNLVRVRVVILAGRKNPAKAQKGFERRLYSEVFFEAFISASIHRRIEEEKTMRMSGNRIAHTFLHRARLRATSSSISSVERPSSAAFCAESRSFRSSCSSSSRHVDFHRQHAFALSPTAILRLFSTNSTKHFEDEVREQIPLQYEKDEGGETTDGWEDDDDMEPEIGDGGGGGGVVLQGVPWGEHVLSLAHEVLLQFGDDIKLYSFKTTPRGYIYVRLDKLSNEFGCPSLEDLESYTQEYKKRLGATGALGKIPDDLALEVSSPGAERLLKVPDDLFRFKAMPMQVSYLEDVVPGGTENDGVFILDHVETESKSCVWKLANVRENRDPLSKGRPLTRKQKEWRLELPYANHKKVFLYLEC